MINGDILLFTQINTAARTWYMKHTAGKNIVDLGNQSINIFVIKMLDVDNTQHETAAIVSWFVSSISGWMRNLAWQI